MARDLLFNQDFQNIGGDYLTIALMNQVMQSQDDTVVKIMQMSLFQ